jgi:hypothetical protein
MFGKLLDLISAEGMLQISFLLEDMNKAVAIHLRWESHQTLRGFSAIGTSIAVTFSLWVLLHHQSDVRALYEGLIDLV